MLFNSYTFLLAFLPLTLLGWWTLRRDRELRLAFLMAASYVFYGYWSWAFGGLMLLSTVVDYVAGRRIHEADRRAVRRRWLWVSVGTNLGILGVFKYAGFFLDNINRVLETAGLDPLSPAMEFVLPIGISFYTFQSMSYSIDIYRGEVEPAESFWAFGAYVSMFPQLVAGPIIRYHEIHRQFRALRQRLAASDIWLAAQFFILGLAKKLLLADYLALHADRLLAGPALGDLALSWVAMLAYTLQIYFDFSGYSDMATGLALLLGFRIPQNFDSPYRAASIGAFWRRWHMTLSFWLRDYLYIGLGGSRGGRLRTLRNLTITMFLGGLWHGAAWTFVIWGLYHGVLLVVHRIWTGFGRAMPRLGARLLTFLAVVVGWVFFRAPDMGAAASILASMAGLREVALQPLLLPGNTEGAGLVAVGLLLVAFFPNTWRMSWRPSRAKAWGLALLFVVCLLHLTRPSPFLYFQF